MSNFEGKFKKSELSLEKSGQIIGRHELPLENSLCFTNSFQTLSNALQTFLKAFQTFSKPFANALQTPFEMQFVKTRVPMEGQIISVVLMITPSVTSLKQSSPLALSMSCSVTAPS